MIVDATREGKQWENPRANGTTSHYGHKSWFGHERWRNDVDGYDPAPSHDTDTPIPVDEYMSRGAVSTKLSRRERKRLKKLRRQQKDPFYHGP
jgi:hypothetical protein